MKLEMDEKLKHRLIGLAVIISIGAIFAPAVMKKSSQTLDKNFSVHVALPPKPTAPNVALHEEQEMFKTIKIAKVAIPHVSDKNQLAGLVKAERIQSDSDPMHRIQEARVGAHIPSEAIQLAVNESAKNTVKTMVASQEPKTLVRVASKEQPASASAESIHTKKIAKAVTRVKAKQNYTVQLASFSQQSNAHALLNRLQAKGYKANLSKVAGKRGPIYKVYVGNSPNKEEVLKLKTQLASSMRINGFVVNAGVS